MKIQSSISQLAVLFSIFYSVSGFCAPAKRPAQQQFWDEVRSLVQNCATQTANGRLFSTCDELRVKGSQAQFNLDGSWYTATLTDSDDSDGGDLNDIIVEDENGKKVAERHDTPAFGDILLGLAGGQALLQEQVN